MCKPAKPKKAVVKEPVIITNPLLDGGMDNDNGLVTASRLGRSSLRIPLSGRRGSAVPYRPRAPGILAAGPGRSGVSPLTPYGTTISY